LQLFYAQPYISDMSGNPSNMSLFPSQEFYANGSAWYLHTYDVSEDIGVRTLTNYPIDTSSWNPTIYVNPFDNTQGSSSLLGVWTTTLLWRGSSVANQVNGQGMYNTQINLPAGTLAAIIDQSSPGWPTLSTGNGAHVDQSLEPIDYDAMLGEPVDTYPGPYTSSLTSALGRIPMDYGLSPVLANLNFNLQGISNFLKYTYIQNVSFSNGTKIQVKMTSGETLVGFENAYEDYNIFNGSTGGVIASIPSSAFANAANYRNDAAANPGSNNPTNDNSLPQTPITHNVQVQGQMARQPDLTGASGQTITYKALPPNSMNTNITNVNPFINVAQLAASDSLSLPSCVQFNGEAELQPNATIRVANMAVTWQGAVIPPTGATVSGSMLGIHNGNIYFPYAIHLDNVYVRVRVTAVMAILDHCSMSANYIGGAPFNVHSLSDQELNDIVLHPEADIIKVQASATGYNDPLSWLVQNGWIIIVIVVISVVVVLAVVLAIFRRGGGGGGHTTISMFNWGKK